MPQAPVIDEPKRDLKGATEANLGVQHRSFEIPRDPAKRQIDEENRTVEVAFSSEVEAERWWGIEVLGHDSDEANLERLNNSAPVLWMHRMDDQRGVVLEARIDSDRVGRALLRIGKGPEADRLWQDILDGIVTKISVGYLVHKMVLVEESDDEPTKYRVTDWEALEISFVSVPMDDTVGVGRSAETPECVTEIETRSAEPPAPSPSPEPTRTVPDTQVTDPPKDPAPAPSTEKAVEDTRQAELARMRDIEALGERYGQQKLAREYVQNGKSVNEFKSDLLEKTGTPAPTDPGIGLSTKEVKRWSFFRLLRHLMDPGDTGMREAAAFELECSRAAAERNKNQDVKGALVPWDVVIGRDVGSEDPDKIPGELSSFRSMMQALKRDLTVGTATAGGNLVGTDLLGMSFIDVLRNTGIMGEFTLLTGLEGDIAIPRHSAATTAYHVAESGSPTEGAPTFDQVTMSPTTVGAYLDLSRRLILQSSIDIENWSMAELAMVISLAMSQMAIDGSGASNEPTGILNQSGIGDVAGGANGAAPTWADITDIKKEVAKDNALRGQPKWLLNSDTIGKLENTERATNTGYFILDADRGGRTVAGFPWAETNQVPNNLTKGTGTNLSAIIFGVLRDVLVGMWGGLDINVDRASLSTQGAVRIVGLQDYDIAVRHVESFSAMQDAVTT